MRPVIPVIAFLLGAFLLPTSEAGRRLRKCSSYPDDPCGDGWSRIDDERCAKYIRSPKTFSEAEEHCRSLNADLVSVHSDDQMAKLLCLTWRVDPEGSKNFWIGAKGSESVFRCTDGSKFELDGRRPREPSNYPGRETCIKLKFKEWGWWKTVRCSREKSFVCTKKM